MEIREGRGVGPQKDHALLDLSHLSPEVILKIISFSSQYFFSIIIIIIMIIILDH